MLENMAKNVNKGKEKSSFHEKMKQFFGIKVSSPINLDKVKTEVYSLTAENIRDVCKESSLNHRLRALKELYQVVRTRHLDENAVEALCDHTKDMIDPQLPVETRHIVLHFYCGIIQGQLEKMNIMRTYFFRLIKIHDIAEDILPRLELLKALSENGKKITYFENDIGPFLRSWLPEIIAAGKASEILPLLVNLIKFNAAYLDDREIESFIQNTCIMCGRSSNEEDLQMCLEVMEAILCYSHLPTAVLQHFIVALCLTVNIEKFSQVSWKLMGNLLGTSLGHTSIFTLCCFLQDKKNLKNYALLRGAVFFIAMALWGTKKVPNLMHPPSAVLPSFRKALDCNSSIVAYEIVLSVQRLVKKSGKQLQAFTWDVILNVIERVLQYPDLQSSVQPVPVLATSLHDLITVVEESIIYTSSDRLFEIIESCSDSRDEESVIRLISHKAQSIQPSKADFIPNMNHLLEKYFKNETRQAVQLEVLGVLRRARHASGHLFEDDLIDQTILLYMPHLELVPDELVRKAAVTLLLEIAEHCLTKRFFEILEIIERVLRRPYESRPESNFTFETQGTFIDIEAAISGLIKVFERKMHLPSNHCANIYNLLISHVEKHYNCAILLEHGGRIRQMIFEFVLRIRASARKQMGLIIDGKLEYSSNILCELSESAKQKIRGEKPETTSPGPAPTVISPSSPSFICYYGLFEVLLKCLRKETDWHVLELCLKGLPKLLQNKNLILICHCSLRAVCAVLGPMIQDKALCVTERLFNAPPRFTRTDLHATMFPVLAAMISYYPYKPTLLDNLSQRIIINSLQAGLVSRSARVCIEGLTLCSLEMRNKMLKLLPLVLLKLSQISATVGVAVSVLEFLSNLIRLPEMYINFVEDQYMAVFAIALPYTNPFKFNQYTVALAHHVIAMWFLKCRIPFRKEFAKFITKGLRNNITIPFEENQNIDGSQKENVDGDTVEKQKSINKSIQALHTELMETGVDLMARFTFGMSSNVPKRSPVAEFLLDKGQKSSWLVGNKIVTITTSGCGIKAFKHGLCEKCYTTCREMSKSMESDESEPGFAVSEKMDRMDKMDMQSDKRRRHRSAIQQRRSTLSHELKNSRLCTKDDIGLHRPDASFEESFSGSDAFSPSSDIFSTNEENSDDKDKKYKRHLCSCWCSSWAEILIRRPTGNTSWMMKIQNRLFLPSSPPEIPLPIITSLLLPHKEENFEEEGKAEEEEENFPEASGDDLEDVKIDSEAVVVQGKERGASSSEALACPKSNSPLRRTNSSPDVNTGWAGFANMEDRMKPHFLNKSEASNLDTCATIEDLIVPSKTLGEGSDRGEMSVNKSVNFELHDTLSSRLSKECKNTKEDSHVSTKSKEVEHKTDLKLNLSLESSFGSSNSAHSSLHSSSERGSLSAGIVQTSKGFSSSASSFRDRAQTITVMSPIHPNRNESAPQRSKDMHRSGMSPSFIFLQLYHNSFFGPSTQKPLLLCQTEVINRAIRVLDRIPPYDTHKIGVIYVGPGQAGNEVEILNNLFGSLRYVQFLRKLGTFVRLCEVDQHSTYVGGLDIKGEDGKFALIWHDDVMQVVFHVATLMPNKKSDVCRNSKKLHIANDFVTIVYNESGEDYNLSTITGQVTSACVIIQPEDCDSNVVTVKVKTEKMVEIFGHTDTYVVSDGSLPIFVRQLALHANLASLILSRQRSTQCSNDPHVSNWLERLRKIKVLRNKVMEERKSFGYDDSLSSEFPSTLSLIHI